MGTVANEELPAYEALARLCTDNGLLDHPAGLGRDDVRDGLNDEVTLLRFLRARRLDADGAFAQFNEAAQTRDSLRTLHLYEKIDIEDFEATRKLYPHWSGRRDKRGLPICVFDIAYLDRNTISGYEKTRHSRGGNGGEGLNAQQHACIYHDSLTRFVLPLCSAMEDREHPASPVTSAVYLVDVSEFGLKQAWDLRSYAQDISKLLAISYPEVVDRVFVLNAPSYFSRIWSYLKRWIDPATADKLVILTAPDVYGTLADYIDHEHIPTQFGGAFAFKHGMLPDLDPTIKEAVLWQAGPEDFSFPAGPLKWVADSEGNGRRVVAVGNVQSSPRCDSLGTLEKRVN